MFITEWSVVSLDFQFQKRWFVLKGNLLFYFESKTSKEPVGVIVLEGCVIELAEEVSQGSVMRQHLLTRLNAFFKRRKWPLTKIYITSDTTYMFMLFYMV